MNDKALTAAELIVELYKLAPTTVLAWHEFDSERDCSFLWSVDGVNSDGELRHGSIIRSWDGIEEDDDE